MHGTTLKAASLDCHHATKYASPDCSVERRYKADQEYGRGFPHGWHLRVDLVSLRESLGFNRSGRVSFAANHGSSVGAAPLQSPVRKHAPLLGTPRGIRCMVGTGKERGGGG